ncbi:hypothetical protein Fmac_010076 [Flemingia macrophylla]|uniref:Uncharacterized protein n=1 Tax=Flemingia macrophylla TaxID=520843 RepID=A0ABD1N2N2_9FABA
MRVKGVAESDQESFLHPTAPALLFSKPLSPPPTNPWPSFACAFHLLPGGTPQQQPPNHRFPHAIPTTHRQNQNRRFLQRPPLPPGKNQVFPLQPRHKPNQKPTRKVSLLWVWLHPPIQRLQDSRNLHAEETCPC